MAEIPRDPQAGYCKAPKHTRFVKGQSGNPTGRPKGSRNIATLLIIEGRKKVQVKINGQVRIMTKIKAGIMQLWNTAASGDLRALQQVLSWQYSMEESEKSGKIPPTIEDADRAVMASLLKRMQNSELLCESDESAAAEPEPSESREE